MATGPNAIHFFIIFYKDDEGWIDEDKISMGYFLTFDNVNQRTEAR